MRVGFYQLVALILSALDSYKTVVKENFHAMRFVVTIIRHVKAACLFVGFIYFYFVFHALRRADDAYLVGEIYSL